MKRRDVLKYTAYMTGAAVSIPLMSTLLTGCKSEAVSNSIKEPLSFFGKEEFSFVKQMVDIILPETDSPSASSVGVHKMIDSMVGKTYKEEDRKKYRKGFDALKNYLEGIKEENKFDYGLQVNVIGDSFHELSQEDKITVLKALDASKENEEARSAYLEFKQQTIAYYLNTEEIGTNFLNYLPVPGEYQGCVDLSSLGGKKWAI